MQLQEIFDNIDSNTDYEIYNDAGTYGIVEEGGSVPDGAEVEATNVSGSTILGDAKKEFKDIYNNMTAPEQNAQQETQEMSEQYYSYLTNGASSTGNLCKS